MATFTVEQEFFIDQLRSMLSMRVVAAAGSSYKLNARLGDEELWEDLRMGLNFFNTYPPIVTTFNFKDLYNASAQEAASGGDPLAPTLETTLSILITPVLTCAMFFSGLRLQWFEAGKHFNFNDNGISIERKKQQDYASIVGGSILQYLNTTLKMIRSTLGFQRLHPKGQFSGQVSYARSLTRGLRGTRLGS